MLVSFLMAYKKTGIQKALIIKHSGLRLSLVCIALCMLQICKSQVHFTPAITSTTLQFKKLVAEKKYRDARKYIDNIIEKSLDNGSNYYNRAVLSYYELQSYPSSSQEIIDDCKKAIELGYDESEVHYLLFSQYCQCDHIFNYGSPVIDGVEITYEIAKKEIDLALSYNYNNLSYLKARVSFFKKFFLSFSRHEMTALDIRTFERDCETVISSTENSIEKSESYFLLSQTALYRKDTAKALGYLTDAIETNRNNLELYDWRASIKYEQENYSGAIQDYSFLLAQSPNKKASIYRERGRCYIFLGKFLSAVNDFNIAIMAFEKERVILLKDKDGFGKVYLQRNELSEAYNLRGLAYAYQKFMAKARLDFNKAVELGSVDGADNIKYFCDN